MSRSFNTSPFLNTDTPDNMHLLLDLISEDMERVNRLLLERAQSEISLIPDIVHHIINSGGKRIRPILTLASSHMCGYRRGDSHIKLAAAVEFMHTATLLHDDVVDESTQRRGRPAARIVWGNQESVLVGDFLLGQAFRMMVETRSLQSLGVLSYAAATIAEGEVMQLTVTHNIETCSDRYIEIISAKTAALFSAAAEVGGILSESSAEHCRALHIFGRDIGIAFQLMDDVLDYSGETKKLGKKIGNDFQEGKITLPIILAFQRGSDKEKDFWRDSINKKKENTTPSEQADLFNHAYILLEKHSCLSDTISLASEYATSAHNVLSVFPKSIYRTALEAATDFCIHRNY